jgi:hypothetical protein
MSPPNQLHSHGSAALAPGAGVMPGSWEEYRLHVVQSLGRIDDALAELKRDVTSLKIRMAVWSAAFGFAGASVPIAIDAILRWWTIAGR